MGERESVGGGRFAIRQYASRERRKWKRKVGADGGKQVRPKEYELYVRRARYKLWLATCMRVITYRDLTVSLPSLVKHRLVRRER